MRKMNTPNKILKVFDQVSAAETWTEIMFQVSSEGHRSEP
jgi:hypothetical protein